jgi:hypothetical protein
MDHDHAFGLAHACERLELHTLERGKIFVGPIHRHDLCHPIAGAARSEHAKRGVALLVGGSVQAVSRVRNDQIGRFAPGLELRLSLWRERDGAMKGERAILQSYDGHHSFQRHARDIAANPA